MHALSVVTALLTLLLLSRATLFADADYLALRQRMTALIESDVRMTRNHIDKDALDPNVMRAMATVARHEFVPREQKRYAYENRPLPIGHGQTISQPYIVALMTDLLEVSPHSRVLEVGTGSGYQAAILAQLVDHVYTIEIIAPLAKRAIHLLRRLKITTVHAKVADGYYGWPEHAPYDAIVVTAAANHVPPPLIKQLKPGGRMVIPVGGRFMTQELLLVTKTRDGEITTRQILPVRFVPLTGGH
jgi:protein-L-isoaspartate(D-aspartate) O-methyltransferase